MEHFILKIKKKKKKTLQSPMKLWGPGERHRPLGPLVLFRAVVLRFACFTDLHELFEFSTPRKYKI